MVKKGFFAIRGRANEALAPCLRGEETTRIESRSGGHADADRARHAGAAQSAIARRVLGEILLMIVLGKIEFARWRKLGGDGAETLCGQRLLVHSLRRIGGLALHIAEGV